MKPEPPIEVYIGMTEGQWPIQIWTSASHATHWLGTSHAEGRRKFVWKAKLTDLREMEYVPPGVATLVEKSEEDHD